MQALFFEQHGGPDRLVVGERPLPEPPAGWVRVALRAAALNQLDIFVLKGMPGVELPHIGGADGAGVVEAVGAGVEGIALGEEVVFDPGVSCGHCAACLAGEQSLCASFELLGEHRDGTLAEQVVVPAASLAPRPAHLSWEESAAFPLTFLTAWRMLFTRAHLAAGETVLIHGIGGGVSLACLALAKLAGAKAFVTSRSAAKLERALALGADDAMPSNDQVAREVKRRTGGRGVDLVVDSVGAATWLMSLKAARRGGRIVTCGATSGPNPAEEIRLIFWNQLSIFGSTMGSREDWRRLLATVVANRLRPVVDSVHPLADGRTAYQRMVQSEQFGKIVVSVAG